MATQSPSSWHDEEVRAARVARVRREIHDGTYECAEKLEIAMTRLFADAGIAEEFEITGLRFESADYNDFKNDS